MTKKELGQKIKTNYPQYQEVDDEILADRIIEKYPSYASQITDNQSITKSVLNQKPNGARNVINQSSTAIKERGQEIKEALTKSKEGKISPVQGAGRVVGSTIAGAGDVLFNVIKEGVRAISPQAVEGVKKGFEKVGETEIAQNVSSIYNDWASKNPEAAKDLNAVLNIASVLPVERAAMLGGKAIVKGTTKGIERGLKSAGTGLKVLGTSGEKAGKTLVSAALPPKEVAGRVLSYKAKTPLVSRFKQAMEGVEKAPITPADVVIKYNLPTVSRSGIGIKAKRVADNLFENQVKPVLKGIKEKVSKNEVFDGIQKTINKEVDISRRKALQTAFDALSDDYKKVSGWSVKTLDDIKSGLTQRLPSKVWKGQDIAGDMNNIRKMFSDEARKSVRSRLPQNVINIYDDYGALKEVSKIGEKALQTGLNQGMIGLAGEALRITTVPAATALGTGISKAGTALRKLGTKLNIKKVNLKNIKPGLTIEDVSKPLPKGKGEILKTTQKNKPETVKVWVKSKFSDSGSYTEFPIIRKVDNKTLYQGSKPGESRQFWTPNKKYAQQFGDVKEKTGSFYQVDNGNRMTDVFVEVKSKSTPLKSKADNLIKEAKKYKSADEFINTKIAKETDFADYHQAPRMDKTPVAKRMEDGGDFSLREVANGKTTAPSDFFDEKVGARYYSYDNLEGRQSFTAINNIIRAEKNGIKDRTITAYRSVPKNVKVDKLQDGDWISFSKEYAEQHGIRRFDGKYKLIKQEVSPDDVWWDANDINEWGYDTGKGIIRKTVEERKRELTDIWNKAQKLK